MSNCKDCYYCTQIFNSGVFVGYRCEYQPLNEGELKNISTNFQRSYMCYLKDFKEDTECDHFEEPNYEPVVIRKFKSGDIVAHFKRQWADLSKNPTEYMYEILGTGFHSETGEKLVIYKALYSNEKIEFGHICCRPYDMFMSKVDKEKYPNSVQTWRFEKVNN